MEIENIQDKRKLLHHISTSKRDTIAILISTTSRGINKDSEISMFPIINIFLKSFCKTVGDLEKQNIAFRFYIGYDDNDHFYSQQKNRQQIAILFRKKLRGMDVRIYFRCFQNKRKSPVFIWNEVFKMAYIDGCDYFYQLGDDILFISNGWALRFINTFNATFIDGIGLIGALDLNNPMLITQAFVGRTHYELFGTLYPSSFQNWYSDDWLFNIYKIHGRCQWGKDVLIKNSGGKEKYVIDKTAEALLPIEMEKANIILENCIQP
jgi:hypothetical protein